LEFFETVFHARDSLCSFLRIPQGQHRKLSNLSPSRHRHLELFRRRHERQHAKYNGKSPPSSKNQPSAVRSRRQHDHTFILDFPYHPRGVFRPFLRFRVPARLERFHISLPHCSPRRAHLRHLVPCRAALYAF